MSTPVPAPVPAAASEGGGDRVLAIVEDANRQFTQWLDADNCDVSDAAMQLYVDVTELSVLERVRLTRLLACHAFNVAPFGHSRDGGVRHTFALCRVASKIARTCKWDEEEREVEDTSESNTSCGRCTAAGEPGFIKLAGCGHLLCPACTTRIMSRPAYRTFATCPACDKKFAFSDMHLIGGGSMPIRDDDAERAE